jgi:hypothetical protein
MINVCSLHPVRTLWRANARLLPSLPLFSLHQNKAISRKQAQFFYSSAIRADTCTEAPVTNFITMFRGPFATVLNCSAALCRSDWAGRNLVDLVLNRIYLGPCVTRHLMQLDDSRRHSTPLDRMVWYPMASPSLPVAQQRLQRIELCLLASNGNLASNASLIPAVWYVQHMQLHFLDAEHRKL